MAELFMLANRFRLLNPVRELRAATVYAAQDVVTGQRFTAYLFRASLCSDSTVYDKLLQNLRAISGVSHPNLATIYAPGYEGGYCYIIYEEVEGQPLSEIIRREGPLPLDTALNIAVQICDGIDALHKAGITNGGVSPDDVMVTGEGLVKLLGAGVPSAIYSMGPSYRIWLDPLYLAPEQLRGGHINPATDVYAIGLIIYEMLCGTYPFQKNDTLRLEPLPMRAFNREISPELEQVVKTALQPEPSLRYRNARQLSQLLKNKVAIAQRIQPSLLERREPLPAPEEEEHIDWLALVLGAIALLAVAGMVILWTIVYNKYAGLL